MILIRSEVENNPFILYGAVYKLNYKLDNLFNNHNFNRVYDSGSVLGYYK